VASDSARSSASNVTARSAENRKGNRLVKGRVTAADVRPPHLAASFVAALPWKCTICQSRPPCVCHKPKLPGLPHASVRAGPCGNFRADSRASSACASKSKTTVCSACILLRRREQRAFCPLGARRFHSVNRRRNSFHRVAPATLEHAVFESSDAGVYTLQAHAIPTRRARGTFGRQQLRQSTSAHGCTPTQLRP
jgi:hypothetical protein